MTGWGSVRALGALLAFAWPLAGVAALAPATPVVQGPGDQTAPSVSAGQLAYADDAGGSRQVWVKDLVSGTSTLHSGAQVAEGGPVLDHGVLAFAVAGGVRVVSFDDPRASASIQIAGAAAISASAQLVAWEQPGAGGRDVAFLPVGTTSPTVLGGAGDEHGPSVSYGWLAWLDDAGVGSVRLRDPGGAITVPFQARALEVSLWGSSRSATPLLALVVEGVGGAAELMVVDTTGAVRGRLARPAALRRPRLGSEWVAFEDLSTGASQVALWQWTTGRLLVPSPTGRPQLLNDLRIEDQVMRLAWADARGADLDVYLFEAPLPIEDLPQGQARCDDPLAPVLADFLVRRVRGRPAVGQAVVTLGAAAPVLVCVDAEDVCAAWVKVGAQAVVSPGDFSGGPCREGRGDHDRGCGHDADRDGAHDDRDHEGDHDGDHDDRGRGDDHHRDHGRGGRLAGDPGRGSPPSPPPRVVRHFEARLGLPAGDSIAEAVVASGRRATLRVRVLADGWSSPTRAACVAGVDCPDPTPVGGGWPGCSPVAPGGALGLLLVPFLLQRAGRRRRR